MTKRLTFTTVAEIRDYAQKRFPADRAFSGMTATEKAYASVYGGAKSAVSLTQLKRDLEEGRKHAQTTAKEKAYQFFLDRIELQVSSLATVTQELSHILEQLQAMQPLVPSDASMDDSEHEEWMRQHADIGMLVDQARHIALWLVPDEVKALLKRIDERCIALYPVVDAELSLEENALYNRAKASEL